MATHRVLPGGAIEYGRLVPAGNGRLAGHLLIVYPALSNGIYPATHVFGSGKMINKRYTGAKLAVEIDKIAAIEAQYEERL